jgi:hypothetical protein
MRLSRYSASIAAQSIDIRRAFSAGNDLTGGIALPMFPAAASPHGMGQNDEKAIKSLGYR